MTTPQGIDARAGAAQPDRLARVRTRYLEMPGPAGVAKRGAA